MMNKQIYLKELSKLKKRMQSVPNTQFTAYAKVVALTTVTIRWEKVALLTKKLDKHPYLYAKEILENAAVLFDSLIDISYIEHEKNKFSDGKSHVKESKHQQLYNEIWDRYDEKTYREFIDRSLHRVKVNKLEKLIKGKKCIDFGCGNGHACFAFLELGAEFTAGIDFGEKSVDYAKRYAKTHKWDKKSQFKQATVYKTGFPTDYFDYAIQNGVFHHLKSEDEGVAEVQRVLKKGGWLWYYVDGQGAVCMDLADVAVEILKDVPVLFIEQVLNSLNVSRNKTVHIMDTLSATYVHQSWEQVTKRLAKFGFGNFRRLTGGYITDFDLDRIKKDKYGKEKFGCGDLRILCQLIKK
jgi:ubiquinone/menaquinone biosynthesis C-methylase UbiE